MEPLTHKTRRESYLTLGDTPKTNQQKVFYALLKNGPMTDWEIMRFLGWNEIGMVRPRRNELINLKLVEECGSRPDQYTKKMNTVFRVKETSDQGEKHWHESE